MFGRRCRHHKTFAVGLQLLVGGHRPGGCLFSYSRVGRKSENHNGDYLEYYDGKYQKDKAIFRENVKMVQEELVVHSDIMIVYFKGKSAQASSTVGQLPSDNSKKEIRVIEAKGHVKITKGESRATCARALYDKQEERIILLGSPVVWQAGTRVSGQKITMFLKENRSIVEGGTRVTIEERIEN